MSAQLFVGVDPGTSGAIAFYSSQGGLLAWSALPVEVAGMDAKGRARRKVSARGLREYVTLQSRRHGFSAFDSVVLVLERMAPFGGPMAGRDNASPIQLMSMGHSAGVVEGVMAAWCTHVMLPTPQQWKLAFGLVRRRLGTGGLPKESTAERKQRSRDAALMRFPQLGSAPHDVCEAVLLALWGAGNLPVVAPAVEDTPDPFARDAA